jgi:inosine triphosphate pyrophosphatase
MSTDTYTGAYTVANHDAAIPSMSRLPILVIGSANYDITCYTSKIPQPGETVLTSPDQQIDLSCGGKGANQAKAVAAISSLSSSSSSLLEMMQPPVKMICRVGDDIFGKEILQQFQHYGIHYDTNTTIVQTNEKVVHTGVASIMVDTSNGDNQIIVTPGANYALEPKDVREAIIAQAAQNRMFMVLLQLEIPYATVHEAILTAATNAHRDANNPKAVIILNPAPVPNDPNVLVTLKNEYLHHVDILIPNETELRQLCLNDMLNIDQQDEEQLATFLLKTYKVRRAVIVTLGSRGALVVERTPKHKLMSNHGDDSNDETEMIITSTYVKAPTEIIQQLNDQSVVDTVGAGDAFCGALTAYLSATIGIQDPISSSNLPHLVGMACGYATLSVHRRGTNYPRSHDIPHCLRIDALVPPSTPSTMVVSAPPPKKVLTFVTGNAKKLEEVRQILGKGIDDFPYIITNQKIDLPELQGNDVYEIAKEKCRIAAKLINGPCFIEDTSLCFNALHGLPGPYIKWFLEKCGHLGLNQMLTGFDDKTAYAQTIVAYSDGSSTNDDDDTEIHVFDGRTDGTIVLPRGNLDFGWDPIFEPKEGMGLTYAEMEKSDKNVISHRGRSFTKFQLFLMDRK